MKKRMGNLFFATMFSFLLLTSMLMGGSISAQDPVIVGYTPPSWHQSDLFPIIGQAIEEALIRWGIPYEFYQAAAGEPTAHEQQMRVVEDFVERGVDYIVISATTPDAQAESVRIANNAGIPIIFVNLGEEFFDSEEYEVLAYVGDDHFVGGMSAINFINDFLDGEGKIGVVYGAPGFVSQKRGEEPVAYLREVSNITVIDGEYAHWRRQDGFRIVEDMVQAHPDIELIYSIASDQAMGGVQAIEASGLSIPVIGFGATKEEVEAVLDGRLLATVLRDPFDQGYITVDIIRMHYEGKSREEIPLVNPTPAHMVYTPEMVYEMVNEAYWKDHVSTHGIIDSGFTFDIERLGDREYDYQLVQESEWIKKWLK